MGRHEFGNRILNLVAELSYTVPVQNLSDAHYRKIREITELVYSQCFEDKVAPTPRFIQGQGVYLLHQNKVVIGMILGCSFPDNLVWSVCIPHQVRRDEILEKNDQELFTTKQGLLDSL